MDRRHSILIEILRHEALPLQSTCSQCQQTSGTHRCQDCFRPPFLCGSCCASTHAHLPFHRIQMWNGHFFERSDLLTHALSLDLRHYPDNCPSISPGTETEIPFNLNLSDEDDDPTDGYQPSEAEPTTHSGSRSEMIIVSSTGIFTRSIRWCHCAKSPEAFIELLLRAKLFPASFKNPKTAFTFEVLDHFRVDALECKMAAMNFMSKLRRITNEAFPSRVPVSYPVDRTSSDTCPIHLSSCRTAIESSSESPESGGISTIELGLDSFMIGQTIGWKEDWRCSAPPVPRQTLTYPPSINGNLKTGKPKCIITLIIYKSEIQ